MSALPLGSFAAQPPCLASDIARQPKVQSLEGGITPAVGRWAYQKLRDRVQSRYKGKKKKSILVTANVEHSPGWRIKWMMRWPHNDGKNLRRRR